MNRIAATVLAIEAVVIALAIPVAVVVADVNAGVAVPVGLGIAVLCVLAASMVRRGRAGYVLGSALQVVALASGFIVTAMFFLGAIFALLWFLLLRIGPEVERSRRVGDT